jgi:hypothetical protein
MMAEDPTVIVTSRAELSELAARQGTPESLSVLLRAAFRSGETEVGVGFNPLNGNVNANVGFEAIPGLRLGANAALTENGLQYGADLTYNPASGGFNLTGSMRVGPDGQESYHLNGTINF